MKDMFYKVSDIFGNEQTILTNNVKTKVKQKNIFDDYEGFVDKFVAKKTTDDCYTPKEVYQIILDYVNENCNLEGKEIIRPFFPGGCYESVEYPKNCIVIDNPPFSIVTKICRYYIKRDIKFFLFYPHLTAFTSFLDCTHIITSADIIYENGASIPTSFVSNLFGSARIIGAPELHKKLEELQKKNRVNLPKYRYPDNIITSSRVAYCVKKGISIKIDKNEAKHYGSGLCEGRASRHESSNIAQCLIVAQMFNKPLMPCFCKTLVMGSTVFNTRF